MHPRRRPAPSLFSSGSPPSPPPPRGSSMRPRRAHDAHSTKLPPPRHLLGGKAHRVVNGMRRPPSPCSSPTSPFSSPSTSARTPAPAPPRRSGPGGAGSGPQDAGSAAPGRRRQLHAPGWLPSPPGSVRDPAPSPKPTATYLNIAGSARSSPVRRLPGGAVAGQGPPSSPTGDGRKTVGRTRLGPEMAGSGEGKPSWGLKSRRADGISPENMAAHV